MKDNFKRAGIVLLVMTGACFSALPDASAQAVSGQVNVSAPTVAPGATADLYLKSGGRFDRAGDLIGMQVLDRDNKNLGTVRDIITDVQNGRVPLAIINLPSENKLTAVPPALLTPQPGNKALVLNLDRQTLVHAPSFTVNTWPDLSNPRWATSIYSFYGQTAYWQTPRNVTGQEIREPAGAYRVPVWISGRDQDLEMDQVLREYQKGKQQARIMDQRLSESAPDLLYPQYPATSPRRSATFTEPAGAQTPPSAPAKLTRTSDLIGASVRDAQGKQIGTVQDVVIDWPANHISYAVVTPTAVTGLPNQYLAIPPTALSRTHDPSVLQVNVDKSKLTVAPGFSGSNWPEPSNQAFLANVYSFYSQKPYWSTEAGTILNP